MRLQEHNGQYHVNIPKNIVEGKNWKKGEQLKLTFGPKGEIIINKK